MYTEMPVLKTVTEQRRRKSSSSNREWIIQFTSRGHFNFREMIIFLLPLIKKKYIQIVLMQYTSQVIGTL
jgi:hypothetical protein